MSLPSTYIGVPIPDRVLAVWHRWEGAAWRTQQHENLMQNPPDERFTVRSPRGMCEAHGEAWLGYRNMHFDPVTGYRWPGNPGSPFLFVGIDMNRLREERRQEWDRKASDQMRLIERICLRGDSPKCSPKPDLQGRWVADRAVETLLLPEVAA